MKKTTIKDVAKEAGVSLAITSFAMNNVKGRVSEDVRQRVLEAAERLGYTPNVSARNLRGKSSGSIALVYNQEFIDERNSSTMQFVSSAVKYAKEKGKDVLLKLMDPKVSIDDFNEEYIKLWASNRVDGIIFQHCVFDPAYITKLNNQKVNYVLVHENIVSKECNSVFINNYNLIQKGIEYINSMGYDEIYYLTQRNFPKSDREIAYLETMKEHGLKGQVLNYESIFRGKGEIWELLSSVIPDRGKRIAIACWNDADAINVIDILHSKGISIPERVGVMGFDDIPASEHTYPPLTTIRQPFDEMARVSVEILEKTFREGGEVPVQTEIEGCIVERSTI